MEDAEWLFFFYMPVAYFLTLRTLFNPDVYPIVLIPFSGILGLSLGVIEGVRRKHARLLWFLISPVLTLVVTTTLVVSRHQVITLAALSILALLLVAQSGFLTLLVYRFAGLRAPAALLSIFGISFAATSAFLTVMTYADTWP